MDLEFFFAGTQSKEETSSAILATLLKHDAAFRRLFMEHIACFPALNPSFDWVVRVEDGRTGFRRFDVTLEFGHTIVVIENKISPGAKREGQLLEYYDAAVERWPAGRLIALYLAPDTSWAEQQVEEVRAAIADRGYVGSEGPDWVQALSVNHIRDNMVGRLQPPVSWFVTSGMQSISAAIETAARRVDRDWTVDDFLAGLALRGPNATLVGQRAIDWLRGRGLQPEFGRGATGPMYLALPRSGGGPRVRVVKVYVPEASVNISYWKLAEAPPFDRVEHRVELIRRLNAVPGTAPIRDEYATESESSYISNEVLASPGALDAFIAVLDWAADEIAFGQTA